MSKKYKVVGSVTNRNVGDTVTEADLKDTNPSFDKLLKSGAIVEEGTEPAAPNVPIGVAGRQTPERVIPDAPNDEQAREQGAATGQMNTKTDFPMPNAPDEEEDTGNEGRTRRRHK
jgi:hypothetical protein